MGSQSWSVAYPSGGNVYYFASEVTLLGTPGKTWELGIGALSAGVLARTTILASSNGGAIARFPGPSTYVSSTIPLSALSSIGSNIIGSPSILASDMSSIVASYLSLNSDLTLNGNLMVIG